MCVKLGIRYPFPDYFLVFAAKNCYPLNSALLENIFY